MTDKAAKGDAQQKEEGLNFLPKTSFEINKDHKNVFYIQDPDEEDQEQDDLGHVIIHRVNSGGSPGTVEEPKAKAEEKK